MKRGLFVMGFVLVSALISPGRVSALTFEEHPPVTKPPSSVVDGVNVPFKVLDYAQMKYQGYAVTKVNRAVRGYEEVYSLRVDRDDIPTDFDSYYLMYDKMWNLLEDKKMAAPPVLEYYRPEPSHEDRKQTSHPSNSDKKEERRVEPTRPREVPDTSGGGGDEPAEEPTDPPKEVTPRSNRGRRNS